jgi:hypothetical protein
MAAVQNELADVCPAERTTQGTERRAALADADFLEQARERIDALHRQGRRAGICGSGAPDQRRTAAAQRLQTRVVGAVASCRRHRRRVVDGYYLSGGQEVHKSARQAVRQHCCFQQPVAVISRQKNSFQASYSRHRLTKARWSTFPKLNVSL